MKFPEFGNKTLQVKKSNFWARTVAVSFSPEWVTNILDLESKIRDREQSYDDMASATTFEQNVKLMCQAEIPDYDEAIKWLKYYESLIMSSASDGIQAPLFMFGYYIAGSSEPPVDYELA